jgi:hypothetical protein
VLEAARALRGGSPDDAAGLTESEKSFRARYLEFTRYFLRMPLPKEEVPALLKALGLARDSASSGSQARHLSVLVEQMGKLKICNACKGEHRIPCERCGSKGEVRLICGSCNGRGTILVAGVGGGERTCPMCNGAGDRGMGPCSGCKGEGSRICKSCEAPFKCPAAADIATWKACPLCDSGALLGNRIGHICPRCFGLGSLLIPGSNKSAELR